MPLPIWRGPTDQLLETPDSPQYSLSRSENKCTRTYMGTHELAIASRLPPGTIGTGAMAGWMVENCKITRQRGGIGKLEINYVSSGAASGQTLPPDEIDIAPFEINPSLETNDRYSSVLSHDDFAAVQNAVTTFQHDGATPKYLVGLSLELYQKKIKGLTNYYLAGFKYSWTRSYYSLVGLANTGGYIEKPQGPLDSFISDNMACLRNADDVKWNGSVYKYTMSWTCAPHAHFDSDLYPPP